MSECIAFGDAHNDLEMLKLVGVGVAMGNVHEVLRTKTKYITETNDNNGVEKFKKLITDVLIFAKIVKMRYIKLR